MTQHDFAMERVTLAILSVTDASLANDPFVIAQECVQARRDYEYVGGLYPSFSFRPQNAIPFWRRWAFWDPN